MKDCKYKENGICSIAKALQILSRLKDEELVCKLTGNEYKLCPSYKEGD